MEIAGSSASQGRPDGSERLVRDLDGALELLPKRGWVPPVVRTSPARRGREGSPRAVEKHRRAIENSVGSRRARRTRARAAQSGRIVTSEFLKKGLGDRKEMLEERSVKVARGETTPNAAAY